MKRIRVKSSNIASIGWEPGPAPWIGTMEVEFVSGSVYRYLGVPATEALRVQLGQLLGSVGHTFHFLIRRESYPYERIR